MTTTLPNLTKLKPNPDWARLPLFDRKGWKRVRFGDVVRQLKEQVDPVIDGVERYVEGGHMETENVHIRQWGNVGDGYLGPAFIRGFRKGQVLYGSRRTYLKKVAVAEWDGVTANTTYVLEADETKLLQRLLPWLMLSEKFTKHSVQESKGSTNPYINFPDIAKFEFDLPPLDQQRRIAEILWAFDETICNWRKTLEAAEAHWQSVSDDIFRQHQGEHHELAATACETITVGIVVKPASYYTDAKSGVAALRSTNVFPDRYDLSELVYLSRVGHEKHQKSQLRKGDVIVVRTARPGDAAVVTDEVAGMNLIDLILVRPKKHLLPEYLVAFLNSSFGRRKVSRGSAGTAQQHFNVGAFERLEIPVPKLKEQTKAIETFVGLKQKYSQCENHFASVVALQKSLLEALLK